MSTVFSFFHFLMGPQNSESLKYWANDEPGFMTGMIAKNVIKGQFAQSLKNGSDISGHVHMPLNIFNCKRAI